MLESMPSKHRQNTSLLHSTRRHPSPHNIVPYLSHRRQLLPVLRNREFTPRGLPRRHVSELLIRNVPALFPGFVPELVIGYIPVLIFVEKSLWVVGDMPGELVGLGPHRVIQVISGLFFGCVSGLVGIVPRLLLRQHSGLLHRSFPSIIRIMSGWVPPNGGHVVR